MVAPRDTRTLQVDEKLAGARIDRALGEALSLSRTRVQALIEGGEVTVGGAPVRAAYRLELGDEIAVTVPPPVSLTALPEPMRLDVLYEDDDVVVLNKPAGLTIHPSPTQMRGTLVNALLAEVRGLSGIGGKLRPGIVHRLDKDTSGALIVAKNDRAHRHLGEAFQSRQVEKIYVAFVYGAPPDAGEWSLPIGRHPTDRKRFSTRAKNGKPALTRFTTVARYRGVSQLRVELLTGRTHQIRVHASDAGYPLVGDDMYGAAKRLKNLAGGAVKRAATAMTRQALHAAELRLTLPSGETRRFVAPWPRDLEDLRLALDAEV